MGHVTIRDWVRSVERASQTELWAMLCFFAGREVELDPDALNAAVRRAELLLASGGDPHRELELYGRSVTAVAQDLDDPVRREELGRGLAALVDEIAGLKGAEEALRLLRGDPELAWQAYAMAMLADALASDASDE